jgi:CRP-like cAMP-binding protein
MNVSREAEGVGLSLFHHLPLSEEDKAILGKLAFVRRICPAHTDIATDGDEHDRTFLVQKGWTVLYRILSSGERQIIDFPLSGDLVGLNGAKYGTQLSFMAVTEATVYEISTMSLVSAAARSKHLAELLFAEDARRRAILVEHLFNLGRRSALSRVAHLLLEIGGRLNMVGLGRQDGYECPLTQYDLADALGLTAIHVNRMLRQLRRSDLLQFHKGDVSLLDRKLLATLAGFDPTYLRREVNRTDD